MRTWIETHPDALFQHLVTDGVPGPAVTFDGRYWQATDGTRWQSTGEVHSAGATPYNRVLCAIVRPVLTNDGQIPGQTSLFDPETVGP